MLAECKCEKPLARWPVKRIYRPQACNKYYALAKPTSRLAETTALQAHTLFYRVSENETT